MKDVHNQTFITVKTCIAEVTGTDPEDIQLHYDFEDDLGISRVIEIPKIVTYLNEQLDIELDPKFVRANVITVEDLVELVIDETVLG